MKAVAYAFEAAASVDAATLALRAGGWGAKPIAGGQSLGAMLNLRLAQPETLVDLDGHHPGPLVEQPEGERSEARPDFEHDLPGCKISDPGNAPDRVRVVHEVLPERLRRPQPDPVGEKPNVRHAEQIGLWSVGHAGTGHVWTVVSPLVPACSRDSGG